eukprot:3874941-Rhodomonas_salina.1
MSVSDLEKSSSPESASLPSTGTMGEVPREAAELPLASPSPSACSGRDGAEPLRREKNESAMRARSASPSSSAGAGRAREREGGNHAKEGQEQRVRKAALRLRGRALACFDGSHQHTVRERGALYNQAEDLRVRDRSAAVRPEAHRGEERDEGDGEKDSHLSRAAAPDKDSRARREKLAPEFNELPVPVRGVVSHQQEADAASGLVLGLVVAVRVPLDRRHSEHAARVEQPRRLPEQAQQFGAGALAELTHAPGIHPRDCDLGRPHLGLAHLLGAAC